MLALSWRQQTEQDKPASLGRAGLQPTGQQRQDLNRSRAVYPGTVDRYETEKHDQSGQQPKDGGNHLDEGCGCWSGHRGNTSNGC
jgi:hypothetical protein